MNKKVLKVIISTILSLILIQMIEVPKANSLFILETNDDQKIAYQSTLVNPYGGNGVIKRIEIIENDIENRIKLQFVLPRNESVRKDINTDTGLTDQYSFSVNSYANCTITKIISNNSKKIETTNNNGKATITYDLIDNDSLTIEIICPVSTLRNDSKLQLPIQINEKIYEKGNNNPIEEFVYMNYLYDELYSSYESDLTPEETPTYPITNATTITFSIADTNDKDLHGNFIAWLNKVYENSTYRTNIITYAKSVYPDKSSLLNNSLALPGINVSCNLTECTFTIEENLEGYAWTYTVGKNSNEMKFTTTDEDTINEAFMYYLEAYFYPGDENATNRTDIYEYAYNNPSLIIKGINGTKYGFKWDSELKVLRLETALLDYIAMTKTPRVPEPFSLDNSGSKLMSALKEYLKASGALSDELLNSLTPNAGKGKEIYASIRKNNNTTYPNLSDKVDFEDYYILHDTGTDSLGNPVDKYILIRIYSNVVSNPSDQNNYVFIKDNFIIPAGVEIQSNTNTDTIVPIQISSTSQEDIETAKIALETYFGENTLVEYSSDTDPETGIITITYNYTKTLGVPSSPSPKKSSELSAKIQELQSTSVEEVTSSKSSEVKTSKRTTTNNKVGKVIKGTAVPSNQNTTTETIEESQVETNTITEEIIVEDSGPLKPTVKTENLIDEEVQSIDEIVNESN